jgi:NADPH:quinone reductase-like Zn-dependent oxidoreductase
MATMETLFFDCLIGTEFAGRRTDTGERVCGFNSGFCIGTSIGVREDLITRIPDNWSMEDAVTIMMAYCTVWYGLIDRAQMQRSIKLKFNK